MSQRFTEEFKIQAVKQVVEHGDSVVSVAERLGVTSSSRYYWIKSYGPDSEKNKQSQDQSHRIKQLEKECSAQLNQDTFLKEFCSYSIGDRSPFAV